MGAFSGTMAMASPASVGRRLMQRLFSRASDPRARARGRRVNLLIVAIALMGLADLFCTLIYMHIIGMVEANPIARHMIEINGSAQLVMFKLLTMLLCSAALYYGRYFRRTEVCAWLCVLVMAALTAHWLRYNSSVSSLTNEIAVIALHRGGPGCEVGERWVSFAEP